MTDNGPSCSSDPNEDFNIDEWENEIIRECPELVRRMCYLDEMEEEEYKMNFVSKKQEKRDRIVRLNEMMKDGRTLYETETAQANPMWKNVLENMVQFNSGPMSMLTRAVQKQAKIEIRTRCLNRIDRIFIGVPMTFDFHLNVVLKNVREIALVSRQLQREPSARGRLQNALPRFLKWCDGGEWPMPIGANRLVQYRDQRACFVKGDTVVLIRSLEKCE